MADYRAVSVLLTLKVYPSKNDLLQHCCVSKEVCIVMRACLSVLFVVLFVCTHCSAVQRLMHRHEVYVYVPVCSCVMSLQTSSLACNSVFFAHVNVKAKNEDLSVFRGSSLNVDVVTAICVI